MDIRALAEKYEGYIIEQRRWFHAHPELSCEEFGTTDHIQEELEKMGLPVDPSTLTVDDALHQLIPLLKRKEELR